MEINVETIAKETIKPSTQTPIHLRHFSLCLLDQLAPDGYAPLVLFYSNDATNLSRGIIDRLRTSLSETLTRFYPLAGRIKDDATVECNDEGVHFVHAKASCVRKEFLQNPDSKEIRKLVPIDIESVGTMSCLLYVQVTVFRCGGLALGVCASYKVADASTLNTFLKGWSASALGLGEVVQPRFDAALAFPPHKFSFTKPSGNARRERCVTVRLVFDASKLAALKSIASGDSVRNPTRVESATGLIWKCAMNASRSNEDCSKLSIMSQSVNIRKRVSPPLPENTFGDISGHFAAEAMESEIELKDVVSQLRKGMHGFKENYVKKLQGKDLFKAISESTKEAGDLLREGNIDFYICASLCRFPFYEVDFGWGKPCWVTIPTGVYKNVIVMMETKDGNGIEAWITLSEEDMVFFIRDQELLSFASVNPSALMSDSSVTIRSSL